MCLDRIRGAVRDWGVVTHHDNLPSFQNYPEKITSISLFSVRMLTDLSNLDVIVLKQNVEKYLHGHSIREGNVGKAMKTVYLFIEVVLGLRWFNCSDEAIALERIRSYIKGRNSALTVDQVEMESKEMLQSLLQTYDEWARDAMMKR